MFLPTTPAEVRERGWQRLDIILVTGDSYIPFGPFLAAGAYLVLLHGAEIVAWYVELTRALVR